MSSIDYISGLPDCILSHILSFVSTKEAASTSVLAKRWRYLFALTPNLDLDDTDYQNPEKERITPRSFVDFVDRMLVLHQHVPLKRFSLKCKGSVHTAIITSWLLKVTARGVLDLDLDMDRPLTSVIFDNETLVRLKLRVRDMLAIFIVNLPKLKTLCLDHVIVVYCEFVKLLNGCEALEELVLNNLSVAESSYIVSHNTLKRLVVRCSRIIDEYKSVSFCAPNLVCLDYSDAIAYEYPTVELPSLVEARLDLQMTKDQLLKAKLSHPEEMVGDATDFLMGICNVKILYLSVNTLQVLTYCCEPVPEFNT